MLRNVPTRNRSKLYYTSESVPVLSCTSSLLASSDSKEDKVVTISPLKEYNNSTTEQSTGAPKENSNKNDLLIESLKELKLDLESIRKEHMEKDRYIQQLKDQLYHKQFQLEEAWKKLENANTRVSRNENETSDSKQSQAIEEQHIRDICEQLASIRDIFALQWTAMENLEAKALTANETLTASHQVSDPFVGILETLDEIGNSSSPYFRPEMMRDILSAIISVMQQNLNYLESIQSSYDKLPEIVGRHEVTLYEKDSIIECQQAIIAVKNEQIESLQKKLEQMSLNVDSQVVKTSFKKQKHLALVHGLVNVVDNILSRLFGNRSKSLEGEETP